MVDESDVQRLIQGQNRFQQQQNKLHKENIDKLVRLDGEVNRIIVDISYFRKDFEELKNEYREDREKMNKRMTIVEGFKNRALGYIAAFSSFSALIVIIVHLIKDSH